MRAEPPDEARDREAEVEPQAFAPGWEREHGADNAEYLDALVDQTTRW